MATKKKTTTNKKTTAKKKAAPKKPTPKSKDLFCGCDGSWENNAWMVLFGIAIGICIGFVLGVTQY